MSGRQGESREPFEGIEPAVHSVSRSLKFASRATAPAVTDAMVAWVEELQCWARGKGYLVGHIKVLLESGEGYCRVSGTGHGVQATVTEHWERSEAGSIDLSVAAIIIGPTAGELEEFAGGALERILARVEGTGSGSQSQGTEEHGLPVETGGPR